MKCTEHRASGAGCSHAGGHETSTHFVQSKGGGPVTTSTSPNLSTQRLR